MRHRDLEDFATTLAPELERRLYVVTAPPHYPALPCDAFATRVTDFSIRLAMIGAGEWDGPRPTIVLGDGERDAEDMRGIIIHELAHLVPFMPSTFEDTDIQPTAGDVENQSRLVMRWATEPEPDNGRPRWEPAHGSEFTRFVLHLHHRAELLGYQIALPCLRSAGERYELSGLWRYRRAIGDEPARNIGERFTTIALQEPPTDFSALFADDVSDWKRRQQLLRSAK